MDKFYSREYTLPWWTNLLPRIAYWSMLKIVKKSTREYPTRERNPIKLNRPIAFLLFNKIKLVRLSRRTPAFVHSRSIEPQCLRPSIAFSVALSYLSIALTMPLRYKVYCSPRIRNGIKSPMFAPETCGIQFSLNQLYSFYQNRQFILYSFLVSFYRIKYTPIYSNSPSSATIFRRMVLFKLACCFSCWQV